MPDTITLLGSLAGLDLQALEGKTVWVRVHHAPDGKLLGGTEPPGTVLGDPGYAPTGYGSTRPLVTDEQGLFGGVLPWEDGGIYAIAVPGDVTRYLMMGTGAGEYPAGSTVNVRMLPGPDGVVTPPLVALDALVGDAVEDYLTAHPPTGGGGVTDHGALTGLADGDHPQYALDADVTTALAGKVDSSDTRLTNARTPTGAAGGDLTGTYPNPGVAKVAGVTVSGAPTAGQVLTATSGAAASWSTPAGGGVADASTTAKGVVQLSGDLAGTAVAPTVAKVNGTTPGTTGTALLGAATAAAAKATLALVKADVGLANVDNTADSAKALAASQITAGTLAYARLPVGASASTIAAGDDSRITGAAQKASNLSDLANAATARSNLGLGAAATREVGTTAGTVAAGDDPRFGAGSGIPATIVDAKGDLIAGTANDTVGRVAAGTNGQVLTSDSSASAGVSWQTVGGKVTITTFPATGAFVEYPIPAGATMLELLLIGGGGGGGSGRRGAASTVRCGGGGGASGAVTRVTLEVAALAAAGITSLWVRSDTGGAGGAAVTANDTSGNAGIAGGVSYVSKTASTTATEIIAYAGGGNGGAGGTASAGAGGTPGLANYGTASGATGGAASATGAVGNNGATGNAGGAPSGGAGGGLTTANAASEGGAGGDARALPSGLTAAGGATGGGAGGNGATALGGWINVGGGGGGGGTQASGAGGAGGAGGLYGGGGGGGGAATNGANSGAGGQGGAGIVRITAW